MIQFAKGRRQVSALLIIFAALLLAGCREERESEPMASAVPTDSRSMDVVLIGSEIEGVYLANAAKEAGLSVVILDPRDEPGGQLIQGEMHFLDEVQDGEGHSLLQGKVKELFDAYKKGTIRKAPEFRSYYGKLLEGIPIESGITVASVDFGTDPATAKKRIQSLHYRTPNGQAQTISAKYWVENSDFAALSSKLGLNRLPGVEVVFGGDKDYMASSLMMKFKNVDWATFKLEVNKLGNDERESKYGKTTTVTDMFTWGFGDVGGRYKPTSPQVFLRGLNAVNQLNGEALINALLVYNVDPSDPESIRQALELGKRESGLILQHLRQELPGWEKAELNGYPNYLYVRDYDRYETEYVLRATDLMSGRMFPDNVSIAGYKLDLQGTQHSVWGREMGHPDKYGMPLRAFLPKGYANVIVAGKNAGAAGIAYGSARIQQNTSIAGEAIGYLLGYLEKGKLPLTGLTDQQMAEFQKTLLSKGITVTGVQGKNKLDEADAGNRELYTREASRIK
ncbi:FAD-dependent oxidoreductase [Paenibacillus cymbidii]|uniref:FAD-dependent oxidoreductase n=1 Tax=Paenibacillus cymbidii TaxID=1639034 RepID=UPI001F2ED266|nr:FAD-dependent oxidoreductase [Paenibacillus cymbidii]